MLNPSADREVNNAYQLSTEKARQWWRNQAFESRKNIVIESDAVINDDKLVEDQTIADIADKDYDDLPDITKQEVELQVESEDIEQVFDVEDEEYLQCSICDDVFTTNEDYELHKSVDHGEEPEDLEESEETYQLTMHPELTRESLRKANNLLTETEERQLYSDYDKNGGVQSSIMPYNVPSVATGKYNDNPNSFFYSNKIFRNGSSTERTSSLGEASSKYARSGVDIHSGDEILATLWKEWKASRSGAFRNFGNWENFVEEDNSDRIQGIKLSGNGFGEQQIWNWWESKNGMRLAESKANEVPFSDNDTKNEWIWTCPKCSQQIDYITNKRFPIDHLRSHGLSDENIEQILDLDFSSSWKMDNFLNESKASEGRTMEQVWNQASPSQREGIMYEGGIEYEETGQSYFGDDGNDSDSLLHNLDDSGTDSGRWSAQNKSAMDSLSNTSYDNLPINIRDRVDSGIISYGLNLEGESKATEKGEWDWLDKGADSKSVDYDEVKYEDDGVSDISVQNTEPKGADANEFLDNVNFGVESVDYVYPTKASEAMGKTYIPVSEAFEEEYEEFEDSDEEMIRETITLRKLTGYGDSAIARELHIKYGVSHEEAFNKISGIEVSTNDKVAQTFFGKMYKECNESEKDELRMYSGSD